MQYDETGEADLQPLLDGRVFTPPAGVELRRGARGLGIHVTRPVRAGEVIYTSGWFTVPDVDHAYRVTTIVDGEPEELTITRLHSVRYGTTRSFDVPGCFMNHACAPTSMSVDRVVDGAVEATVYDEIALVDLAPGDEITCDYALFDWDCDGHAFTCACGAAQCYGEFAGLQSLPRQIQERLAPRLSYEAARMWALATAR